jgi:hypothetical protein
MDGLKEGEVRGRMRVNLSHDVDYENALAAVLT